MRMLGLGTGIDHEPRPSMCERPWPTRHYRGPSPDAGRLVLSGQFVRLLRFIKALLRVVHPRREVCATGSEAGCDVPW